jgi:hypothetical protein
MAGHSWAGLRVTGYGLTNYAPVAHFLTLMEGGGYASCVMRNNNMYYGTQPKLDSSLRPWLATTLFLCN